MTGARGGLRMRYLSDAQVTKVHGNALDLLATHGFQVEHRRALEALADAGATVDFDRRVVRVKRDLVEKAMKSGRESLVLGARDPARAVTVETDAARPVFRNGGGVDRLVDPETGRFRDMGIADVAALTRALDGFDYLDVVSPLYALDVPAPIRELVVLQTLFENTTKHVNIRTFSRKNLDLLVRMGEIVAGGRDSFRTNPVFSLFDSPLSPLKFPELTVEVFLEAGRNGIPLYMANLPIAGGTGPFPLAGMIQLIHTELLASVVLCQTINPGAPVLLHPLAMTMDWTTLVGLSASIEATIVTAAAVQMANEIFHAPVDVHGPWSDTLTTDAQAAMEHTLQTVFPALSGAASIAGFGDLQEGMAFDPVALGLGEELVGATRKALEPIPFDDDRLAVDAIRRAGFDGDFTTDETTLAYLRSDYYRPRLLNRQGRADWERTGARDFNARARDRVRDLMATHKPRPLSVGMRRELQQVVDGARAAL